MSVTNFGSLLDEQKLVWSRDLWHQARTKMFITTFMGTSQNSLIQRITELTKSERGDKAVITLIPDHDEDGIAGDSTLANNEVALTAQDDTIQVDQLRQAHLNKGRMADQKTIVNFREQARDQLSYWIADRMDQLAFLVMSSKHFKFTNRGAERVGDQITLGTGLDTLAFNPLGDARLVNPSAQRHVRVSGTALAAGDVTAMTLGDTLGYRHIVLLQAMAKDRYIRGVKGDGGSEVYHLFLTPQAMAVLKLDPDFLLNARHAGVRGSSNSLWAGGDSFKVDGLIIHEYRHVFNTLGATAGTSANVGADYYKWGADADVDGVRALLCGAQSMAFIDLGDGIWDERDHMDYGNTQGISYAKLFGMKKPVFENAKLSTTTDGTNYPGGATPRTGVEDYGVIAVDFTLD